MKKLLFCMIFLLSNTVFAQETSGTKKKVYKKTQEVNFEAQEIDGLVRSPDGAYLNQKKNTKYLPLYKVHKAFDKEIKNSVEHLR